MREAAGIESTRTSRLSSQTRSLGPDQMNFEESMYTYNEEVLLTHIRSHTSTCITHPLQGALVANYPMDGTQDRSTQYAASPDDGTFRHLATKYAQAHTRMALPTNKVGAWVHACGAASVVLPFPAPGIDRVHGHHPITGVSQWRHHQWRGVVSHLRQHAGLGLPRDRLLRADAGGVGVQVATRGQPGGVVEGEQGIPPGSAPAGCAGRVRTIWGGWSEGLACTRVWSRGCHPGAAAAAQFGIVAAASAQEQRVTASMLVVFLDLALKTS